MNLYGCQIDLIHKLFQNKNHLGDSYGSIGGFLVFVMHLQELVLNVSEFSTFKVHPMLLWSFTALKGSDEHLITALTQACVDRVREMNAKLA
jgi:hypothetical protein